MAVELSCCVLWQCRGFVVVQGQVSVESGRWLEQTTSHGAATIGVLTLTLACHL